MLQWLHDSYWKFNECKSFKVNHVNTQIEMCGQLIMGLVLFMTIKVKFLEKISYSTNLLNTYTLAISITFMYFTSIF
jgi:hypothetical protein